MLWGPSVMHPSMQERGKSHVISHNGVIKSTMDSPIATSLAGVAVALAATGHFAPHIVAIGRRRAMCPLPEVLLGMIAVNSQQTSQEFEENGRSKFWFLFDRLTLTLSLGPHTIETEVSLELSHRVDIEHVRMIQFLHKFISFWCLIFDLNPSTWP